MTPVYFHQIWSRAAQLHLGRSICCILLFCCMPLPMMQAKDPAWPQWRGPGRDDLSQETGLLQSWPEQGPPLKWLYKDCGLGYSGPSVVAGRLYIMGARDGVEQLLAMDVDTGQEHWSLDIGPMLENAWGSGGSYTHISRESCLCHFRVWSWRHAVALRPKQFGGRSISG